MRRAAMVLALLTVALPAQEELRWDGPMPATVRLGDVSQVQIQILGTDAEPRAPELPKVEGMQLQLSGPSTQFSSSFVSGRMLRSKVVDYTVVLRPLREGKFVVPPIKVFTGTRTQQLPDLRIEAVKDPRGDEYGYLDITVEPRRVYVHEPVHVFIDCGIDAGLRPVISSARDRSGNTYEYYDVDVQAAWLSKMSGAVPIDLPQANLPVVLNLNGTPVMSGREANASRNGKRWHRLWLERAFLPTRAGSLELGAPMLRYQIVLQQGRGLFGEPVNARTQNYYVYGKPIKIEVLPIPETGRPNPYFGGVGRFQIEANLDRQSVKVGGSVKLTFTVRGEGNLEFLRVPELDALKGFHKRGQTEKRDQQHVQVVYDLSPTDPAITEVPGIEWNWFDTTPGVEKFVESKTRPIPLQVRPLENGESMTALPGTAETRPVVPGVDDIFDLRPLDGSVSTPVRSGPASTWIAVIGPWLGVLLLAFVIRFQRARAADPLGRAARSAAGRCERALRGDTPPVDALVQYLADRLGVNAAAVIGPDLQSRLVTAGLQEEPAAEAASAVERGTAGRYGGGAGLDAAAVRELVRRLEPVHLQRTQQVLAVLLTGLLFSAALTAQQPVEVAPTVPAAEGPPDVADAVAAYRKGDYKTATAGFRAAAERTGDARLWANLGNACYRNGDLPRAVWAWRSALRGLPRDDEIRANLQLATRKLELGDGGGEPFLQALARLRDRLTFGELLLVTGACQALAALLLLLGFRKRSLRAIGVICLVPGIALAIEVLWLRPGRPAEGIALVPVRIQAEPRGDLPPVATVRAGAALDVLGRSDTWLRVEAGGRKGYARADQVAEVR